MGAKENGEAKRTLPFWCGDVKGWEGSVADKLADKLARPQRNRVISCEAGGGGGTE
jgi:hypothetical protein